MLNRRIVLAASLISIACLAPVHADIVIFKVPTTSLKFVLQGKATIVRSSPMMSFAHISKSTFELPQGDMSEVITLPTLNQLAIKRLVKAKGDAALMRETAVWCLEHGLLPEFHRALDQLSAIESTEPFAVEAKKLKEAFAKPISDDAKAEAEFQKTLGKSASQVTRSAHFVLFHGEPEKGTTKRRRPEGRLEQLEQLYEIFVMKCAERAIPITIPTEKFKVAAIANPKFTPEPSRSLPRDNSAVWSPSSNLLTLNDGAKSAPLEALRKLQNDVQKQSSVPKTKRNQPGGGGIPGGAGGPGMAAGGPGMAAGGGGAEMLAQLSSTQLAKLLVTLQALLTIGVENQELENLSRETAYQFIHNCQVLPASGPRWVRDGLATYFEIPAETGLLQIGDLGTVRNAWYQASLQDPIRLTLDDIINDRCYDGAQSPNDFMRATTLSWAAIHFLMHRNTDGLGNFLAACHELPPDVIPSPQVVRTLFQSSFEVDSSQLETEFREYMAGLKPSYDKLREEDEDTGSATTEN